MTLVRLPRVSGRHVGLIAVLLIGAAFVAYGSCRPEPSSPRSRNLALADDKTPFALEKVAFEDEATRRRLIALETCAREIADGGMRGIPWILTGNWVEERWCGEKAAVDDCFVGDYARFFRAQHEITISTVHSGDGDSGYRAPYFGLRFSADWVPPATGWGASFYFSEGGKDIVAENFELRFERFTAEKGPPADTLTLGDGYRYEILTEEPALAVPTLPLRADLARYVASADALREAGAALLAKARADVVELLSGQKLKVRVHASYAEDGAPPMYTLRDPTPAEAALELAKAKSHFDAEDALLSAYYREMYAALLQAFPMDRCWSRQPPVQVAPP